MSFRGGLLRSLRTSRASITRVDFAGAGLEDLRRPHDVENAAGLTQFLAETASNFLGMSVDLAAVNWLRGDEGLALQDHESGGARGSSRRGRLPWKPSATSGSAIILALVPNRRGS